MWGEVAEGSHVLPAPVLPGDLAEVLHILEPSAEVSGAVWRWLAVAAVLAFLLWRRSRWRPPLASPITPSPPPPPRSPTARDLVNRIEELRSQTLYTRRYREGCHRLAALLRQRGEAVESRPMTVWTQGEIAAYLGDVPLSRVMGLLAELQFGREAPQRGDFEGVCDLAAEASQGRRW